MYDRNIATPANHSMSNHFSTNTEHKRRRRCWNYPNAFIHLSHILYECTASLVHTTDIHYTKVYTEQVCNMLFYVSVLRIPNTKHRRNSPAFVILLISYQVFPVVSLALVFVQTPLSYARFFFFFSSRFCFKWYRSIRRWLASQIGICGFWPHWSAPRSAPFHFQNVWGGLALFRINTIQSLTNCEYEFISMATVPCLNMDIGQLNDFERNVSARKEPECIQRSAECQAYPNKCTNTNSLSGLRCGFKF